MEQSIIKYIEQAIRENWEELALTDFNGVSFQYRTIARKIAKLHIAYETAGIKKGDKIALCGRNSAQWSIAFLASLTYGAVPVPILHDFKPDTIHHLVNHSEARLLYTDNSIWENLNSDTMDNLLGVIHISDYGLMFSRSEKLNYARKHLNELFGKKYPERFTPEDVVYEDAAPESLALINYTSGSTGLSKGVMIPYRALTSNITYAIEHLTFLKKGDGMVCMLPLAHMYGLVIEMIHPLVKGCHIYFLTKLPSPKVIMDAFATVHPKLIVSVPLILEKIIKTKVFPLLEKPLMRIMMKVPGLDERLLAKIKEKLQETFGGQLQEFIIGGAALNKDVEAFLRKINFPFTVGYGMTECGPLIAYAQWDEFKPGSVGKIIDRMEVRIDSDDPRHKVGEIWVRGMNNMLGYYKNQEATSEVMTPDGWMRTGDLGTLDADGFLFIRGRCKTMILGPNGQNIYPEEIENKLNNMPLVVESLVVSDGKKLTALIYPDWKRIESQGMTSQDVDGEMEQYIKMVNRVVPRYCKISRFELRKNDFEKTPKKSIKRYLYQKPLS